MEKTNTVVAVFTEHAAAEAATKELAGAGFAMRQLSVVGKGYHTEDKVVGFYNTGDRVRFWGSRGAIWGGLWGLFMGGLFMTVPGVGALVVLGHLVAAAVIGMENAALVGGLSALSAALFSIGIPKNSVLQYEAAVKADGFLVMAHGSAEQVARARALLGTTKPAQLDSYGASVGLPEVIALGAA